MRDRLTPDEHIALLKEAVDAAHDGILVVDLARRVLVYNKPYLTMFGVTAETLERDGVDAIVEGLATQVVDVNALVDTSRLFSSDQANEIRDVVRFLDGRILERHVTPLRIASRITGVVSSFRDISTSVHAAESLEQHRGFLETAQEVAHIGSWVAELDGLDHLGWSNETHRIFGVAPGQFDGTREAFYALIHPDDRDSLRAAAERSEEDGSPFAIDHRILRGDGSTRWVHEQASVVCDAAGRALRLVGTVQDITDRRHLEEQLRQAQKMDAIGRLAGGIAHDLNNALTTIAGYAELALGQAGVPVQARTDLDEIRRAAERAGSVTRQLLAFSRKQLLEPRLFDLNETVASLSHMLARLLGPDITIGMRPQSHLPPVLGDPAQIEQAVINLAVNARDAMQGGGRLELATTLEHVTDGVDFSSAPSRPGRYVVLTVGDSGIGMSREVQARIFEPFFTTKDVGKGTGLGLSMVYSTMSQLNGFVVVESQPGRGTTFRLHFPAAEKPAASTPDTPVEGERRGHETLLVVEDEAAVRDLVASSLRRDGYRLLLANSADEAIRIADAHEGPLDLLLTDVVMPGTSGLDLVHTMVARRPDIAVIVMSGYIERLDADGPDAAIPLLKKPFSPLELRRRVRERLDR